MTWPISATARPMRNWWYRLPLFGRMFSLNNGGPIKEVRSPLGPEIVESRLQDALRGVDVGNVERRPYGRIRDGTFIISFRVFPGISWYAGQRLYGAVSDGEAGGSKIVASWRLPIGVGLSIFALPLGVALLVAAIVQYISGPRNWSDASAGSFVYFGIEGLTALGASLFTGAVWAVMGRMPSIDWLVTLCEGEVVPTSDSSVALFENR